MLQPLCRYCTGSPTGLLNSWDNCRELCTSCYRSRCLSSVRMGQHNSLACQAKAVFLSQVSYASLLHLCSLYLPFSRSNFAALVQRWEDCSEGSLCPVGIGAWHLWHSSRLKCGAGLKPTPFPGQCYSLKNEWKYNVCVLSSGCWAHSLPSTLCLELAWVGELKGSIPF